MQGVLRIFIRHTVWCGMGLLLGLSGLEVQAGRFEAFTRKAAEGEKMKVIAASYFGSGGNEEFLAAGLLPDGTIVAFGNAWGPEFPASPAPQVLGKGQHRGLNPYGPARKEGTKTLRDDNPDIAGMVVLWGDKLQSVKQVIRFDWGVASIATGCVAADGKAVYLAGRCTPALRELARTTKVLQVHPLPPPAEEPTPKKKKAPATTGPYDYEGVTCSGDTFLARLSLAGATLEWVHIFEGQRKPAEQLWLDKQGAVYGEMRGLVRVSADGQSFRTVVPRPSSGTAQYLCVEPTDGSVFFGGDRNTHTGRQPWRQPYLYKYDRNGERQWKLWEWPPRECACGGGGNGLCSDSSPRAMDIAPNGDYLVSGWSDGGNSVFGRQLTDVNRPAPRGGFGMDSSGMKSANSISHIMRIDPHTLELKAYAIWVAYVPENFENPRFRGAPNFTSVRQIKVLGDGSIALAGQAATGLIQTPNAFYKYPGDGRKYGGSFVTVFSEDFRTLLFSSYLPGCQEPVIAPAPQGCIIVSRSRGIDQDPTSPTPTPTVNAWQPQKKGEYDAHIILLAR